MKQVNVKEAVSMYKAPSSPMVLVPEGALLRDDTQEWK